MGDRSGDWALRVAGPQDALVGATCSPSRGRVWAWVQLGTHGPLVSLLAVWPRTVLNLSASQHLHSVRGWNLGESVPAEMSRVPLHLPDDRNSLVGLGGTRSGLTYSASGSWSPNLATVENCENWGVLFIRPFEPHSQPVCSNWVWIQPQSSASL